MVKINRKLKQRFPTIGDFDKKLKEELSADGNGNVPVDQLRDFVLRLVE